MKRLVAHWWTEHPGVRSHDQLTLGERAADKMRLGMGSWPFVFGALGFLAVWMLTDGAGRDAFPWILLNLILSCLAALQGAILLIAAKRSDQISAELAKHTHDNTSKQLDEIELLRKVNAQQLLILEELRAQRDGAR